MAEAEVGSGRDPPGGVGARAAAAGLREACGGAAQATERVLRDNKQWNTRNDLAWRTRECRRRPVAEWCGGQAGQDGGLSRSLDRYSPTLSRGPCLRRSSCPKSDVCTLAFSVRVVRRSLCNARVLINARSASKEVARARF